MDYDYKEVICRYIDAHKITKENCENVLKNVGYIEFFNDITVGCLGEPNTINKKKQQTTSAIIYFPELAKERLISNFDVVYVTNLYYGIISNGCLGFNYYNYSHFLEFLFDLRCSLKKKLMKNYDEETELISYLIKIYMNVVYGMLDNPSSVISTNKVNPREFIVSQAKQVILELVSFFINKSCPIFYIDCDEIFVPHVGSDNLEEAKKYFKKNMDAYTNTKVSTVSIDDVDTNLFGYMTGKKKMIYGQKIRTMGFKKIDTAKLLVQNKKYFGKTYKDVFPEYAIW